MSDTVGNFFIVFKGRGVLHTAMATGVELEQLANRCHICTHSGFEAYIYSIQAGPVQQLPYLPEGILLLKREYYIHDVEPAFDDLASSIENKLDEFCQEGSIELQSKLELFLRELTQRRQPTGS